MNPIFLDLGFVKIYYYSVILLVAFLLGGFVGIKEAKKHNISKETMLDLYFYLIVFSLIGARIYYVIFNLDYYLQDPISIIKVWEGGEAIHGGIIAGVITIYYFGKKHKLNPIKLTDILAVSLALGQAIGRWGNFMNGEAHGPITTLSHLKDMHIPHFIINGMYIEGNYYIPTFLYESLFCLILFVTLYIIRKRKNTKIGLITSLYLIFYGIERFIVEGLRTDSLMLLNLKMAQLVSIIMIIIGISLLIKSFKNKKYN